MNIEIREAVDKEHNKLSEHYAEIFKEYENEKFPLTLLGKYGYMTFKDNKELKEYYEQKSKLDD